MAKPNYSFEKRQRELAKKDKKVKKEREKADRKASSPADGSEPSTTDEAAGNAVARPTVVGPTGN